jgi:hypothetical protein
MVIEPRLGGNVPERGFLLPAFMAFRCDKRTLGAVIVLNMIVGANLLRHYNDPALWSWLDNISFRVMFQTK